MSETLKVYAKLSDISLRYQWQSSMIFLLLK